MNTTQATTSSTAVDFRIAKRDAALSRGAELEALAARGGDAYWGAEGNLAQADRAYAFAAWVQAAIDAHPYRAR